MAQSEIWDIFIYKQPPIFCYKEDNPPSHGLASQNITIITVDFYADEEARFLCANPEVSIFV